jgi:D-glycero-D-manno-heptose 1,7-bisphosphate phosphatase
MLKALLWAVEPGISSHTPPACLAPLRGRPVIEYWVDQLAAIGVTDIGVSTGPNRSLMAPALDRINARGGPRLVDLQESGWRGAWADAAAELFVIDAAHPEPVRLSALVGSHRRSGEPISMLAAGVLMLEAEARGDWDAAIAAPFGRTQAWNAAASAAGLPAGYGPDGRRPAVFFDRDGTLIEFVHYLADPKHVRLAHGAVPALRLLHSHGWAAVIVTNQAEVGRGRLALERLEEIHQELRRQLSAEGVGLDGIYFNTAVPTSSDPAAIDDPERKPGPGMLLRAAGDLHLRLADSWMIGDTLPDALAGQNAGCRGSVLLRGEFATPVPYRVEDTGFPVFRSLPEAIGHILKAGG